MTDYGLAFTPGQAERFARSRLDVAVVHERGYHAADNVAQLRRHGFDDAASSWLPGVLIPWHAPDGGIVWQYRPDYPGDGPKYLFPKGTHPGVDVHPSVRDALTDVDLALWLTEGVYKVDALISAGVKALGLIGVYGWLMRDGDESVVHPHFDLIEWRDRVVFVCFDADAATSVDVWTATKRLTGELRRRGAHVLIVRVPMVNADGHTGVDDYLASLPDVDAADLVGQLEDEATDELPPKPEPKLPVTLSGRPIVDTSGVRPVLDVALDLMGKLRTSDSRSHDLFDHGGQLAIVQAGTGVPAVEAVDDGRLLWLVGRACDPMRFDRSGAPQTHVAPSASVMRLLSSSAGEWPRLDGVTTTPLLRPDGEFATVPGYDFETRYVYRPMPGFALPELPEPVDEVVARAVELLDDATADFGLEGADRANALALMLTPFLRAVVGMVPLFVIDSTTPGSGKGLLVQLVSCIAAGRPLGTWPFPTDAEESRKLFTTVLSMAPPIALLDEAGTIGGRHLANLLTSPQWNDRAMKTQRSVSYPNRTIWIAAGNNVGVRGDLGRRVIFVRLRPSSAHPERRPSSSFRHHPLLGWALLHRAELVHAVLVLVHAWVESGRPAGPLVMGSFEEWSTTVSGVLGVAGVKMSPDDLAARVDDVDVEAGEWHAFFEWWYGHYGTRPVTVRQLGLDAAGAGVELPSFLGDPLDRAFGSTFGHALRQRRGRPFGSYSVEPAGRDAHTRNTQWRIVYRPEHVF